MAKSQIVGPDGQPIELGQLTQEVATGGLFGVRQPWYESIARGLTPASLSALLERAAEGDADDYLTLAEEMEERDPHYAAVLGVRKRAVQGLPVVIEAGSEDALDEKIAEDLRELVSRPEFGELKADLLDGIGKSYSVCETLWNRGTQWWPRCYEHRDPRWFCWDRETGQKLRLRDQANPIDGVPLNAFQFIVHRPRSKSGLPIRSGIARLVAFTWICKAYAQKDWLAYAEVFGMPLRLGMYGPNATPADIRILKQAVASIGSDAAAVLPESMKIEFPEIAAGAGGHELYAKLCRFLDEQISKAVLGQTNTTDAQAGGMGSGQANVHNDVRSDIKVADAQDLESTLNRDLVRPFVDLNYGPQKKYPKLRLQISEPEDLKMISQYLKDMVPESWVRDKIGAPQPADDARVLAAPAAAPAPAEPALNHRRVALNAAQTSAAASDQVDRLVDEGLRDWTDQMDEIIDPVEKLAQECSTPEVFLRRLPELATTVEPKKLLQGLAAAAYKARGLGEGSDQV